MRVPETGNFWGKFRRRAARFRQMESAYGMSDISADGSELLARDFAPAMSGTALFAGTVGIAATIEWGVSASAGAWGPGGKLYYASGNDLFVAEHDGASPKKLASTPN